MKAEGQSGALDVKTVKIYELMQKLKFAEDEIKRLKKKVAYYQQVLSIETDTEPLDLTDVAKGEVLDG